MDYTQGLAHAVGHREVPPRLFRPGLVYFEAEHRLHGGRLRGPVVWGGHHPRQAIVRAFVATFDKLSADQRAIIELVLRRGQSYEDLSGVLGMPEARIRELARTALVSLTPLTAQRVDGDWRGQLADYVLGQQTGPESTATRGHLRRSEPARSWTRSLLDSLDELYDGDVPAIPDGDRAAGRDRARRGKDRSRRAAVEPAAREPEPPPLLRRRQELSPAARSAVRRRRQIGAGAGALILIAVAVLVWPIGVLSGNNDNGSSSTASQSSTKPRVVGQTVLRPVEGGQGAGIAVVAERRGQRQIVVQARLPPNQRRQAYEVWLWNSDSDAKSLGAQVTDRQGNYQGAGPLPSDFSRFKYIDISREPIDQNPRHSGQSVLRGSLAPLKRG
jgi:anti-sigma-K factor RskA/sigma-70-like protein